MAKDRMGGNRKAVVVAGLLILALIGILLLRKFKGYCRSRNLNMSRLLEKHIKEELQRAT